MAALLLPGWTHSYSGKVRDLYRPADASAADSFVADAAPAELLVVASDRVSAFDFVLEPAIPEKGALLTRLSLWWFEQLGVPNHLLGDPAAWGERIPDAVRGQAMLVRGLEMFPVECVVRGYLTGSGWAEYQRDGTVCGIPLPAGLGNGDRLPEPIYTPAWKAPQGEHDENISFERTVELVGPETAEALRERSLHIYRTAAAIAEARGLILADTKFEFGADPLTGEVTLADEVLTSDSSRYWDAHGYAEGMTPEQRMASFDKQIVRNWLAANWDRSGAPPELPESIVSETAAKYRELITRLMG